MPLRKNGIDGRPRKQAVFRRLRHDAAAGAKLLALQLLGTMLNTAACAEVSVHLLCSKMYTVGFGP